MRDGEGNKLSDDEAAKIREAKVQPVHAPLNNVSVEPPPGTKPVEEMGDQPEPPERVTAPKF